MFLHDTVLLYDAEYDCSDCICNGKEDMVLSACRDGDTGPQALFYAQGLQESYTALNQVFNQSANDSEVSRFSAQPVICQCSC